MSAAGRKGFDKRAEITYNETSYFLKNGMSERKDRFMDITLDRQEILRYLGYRGQMIDNRTQKELDGCMQELLETAKPRYCYRIFEVRQDLEKEEIVLPQCDLRLLGRDIYEHLRGSRKCAVMAATLGIEADNLIRISEAESMTRAVILDACAADMIEKVCDMAEAEIGALAAAEGCGLTSRYSPGYGDFPLSVQESISRILDTGRQIGLTVTENQLMIPRKSVTALIGFSLRPGLKKKGSRCAVCSMRGRCKFRKEGTYCGR
ncbi:methionine synthase [Oscillospiraceae bacterium DSM 107454]|uniref:Methionine synthase n=2 Tax=Ructibacterium gallinarum TaxID=2779355 RepID=A0A9D5RC50_9FIRM|nr:methionine synthase [Ructibacterium gallinarum]